MASRSALGSPVPGLLTIREIESVARRLDAESRANLLWTARLFVSKVARPVLSARTLGAARKKFQQAYGDATMARLRILELIASAVVDPVSLAKEALRELETISRRAEQKLGPSFDYFTHALDHLVRANERMSRAIQEQRVPSESPANLDRAFRIQSQVNAIDILLMVIRCGVDGTVEDKSANVFAALAREAYDRALSHHEAIRSFFGSRERSSGRIRRAARTVTDVEDRDLYEWTAALQAPTFDA